MPKQQYDNIYDVIYRTKNGRVIVAKRIEAKTANEAKAKLKRAMRASSTFDKILMAIKLP